MITTIKPKLVMIPLVIFTVSVFGPIFSHSQNFVEAEATSINVTDTSETNVRSYYSTLNGLVTSQRQGNNLLTNLGPILKQNHSYVSYDGTTGTWAYFKITDRDWNLSPLTSTQLANYTLSSSSSLDDPYVHLLYRDDNGTATAAKYSDTHGTYIDREHVWPQSHGFKATSGATGPAGTDLHHLMLGDSTQNQQAHNNNDWGNVGATYDTYGSIANHNDTGKAGYITYNSIYGRIYEPQDSDKGDIARACFYMVARYSSYTSAFDPYLQLIDAISGTTTQSSSANVPATLGCLNTLLQWNALDPVDDYEIHRNNLIYNNVQHNRNPFIDYPSWVDVVWGIGGAVANPATDTVKLYGQTTTAPTALTLSPSSSTITVSGTQSLIVTPTPSSASNSVTWSSSNDSVATVSGGVVTGVVAGSATITATSTLNGTVTATSTVTVSSAPVKTLTSITLSGSISSAVFNSTYSTSGIVVTAHYSDSTTANVTSSALINSPNTSILGLQSVRVSYSANAITQSAYYDVKVTNNGFIVGPKLGTEYVSATASTGTIANWTNVGTIGTYADGSVKLEGSGMYLYNANIWAGSLSTNFSSISLTVKIKQNGGTDNTTPNVMTVYAINGSDSVEIASASQTAGFNTTPADEAFTISGISTSATITGIKIVYTTKNLGNLGVYYVKVTPTYIDPATNVEQATAFANYVMDGIGSSAAGSCSSVFTELQTEYNYMVSASKTEFNTNSDEVFVTARTRYNYLANYLGRPGDTIGALVSSEVSSNGDSSFGLILLISILGLTSMLFYSFSSKKRDI